MVEEFDSKRMAEIFGEYGRIYHKYKNKNMPTDELKKFLNYQRKIENLNREQILKVAENYKEMISFEDIKSHSTYQDLKEELNELKLKNSKLKNKYSTLRDKIIKITQPFSDLEKSLE